MPLPTPCERCGSLYPKRKIAYPDVGQVCDECLAELEKAKKAKED
jgi:hypothetical protein